MFATALAACFRCPGLMRYALAHWIAVQLLGLRGFEGSNERERQPAPTASAT